MKIAILGTRGYPYIYSGYETFVKELGERLVERGIEVTVYCHRNLFTSFPRRVNGLQLVYLPTVEKKSMSQLLHSVQAMIHASVTKKDILLVVNPANGPLGWIPKIFRRKTAINTDGLEWLRPKWHGIGAAYFHWAARASTKLYDCLVSDSYQMQKIYEKEFGAASTVIAYGANIKYSSRPELLNKWKLTKQGYYLVVGRLIPDNNSDVVIREFLTSQSKKELVIVGDVPYKDEYAEKIKSITNQRIIFAGYVTDGDELNELYQNCFAYIHGHEFGGTNPTMLTAMASGCAVIALDTPFTREMCDGQRHAIYFTKEKGNLAAILLTHESDASKIKILRETSRDRITQNYTWEKITEQYIDLFKRMISPDGNKISW